MAMNDLDRLSCESAVRDLVAAYARHADALDGPGVVALFAPDGELSVGGASYTGPEGIGGWMAKIAGMGAPRGRHIVSNLLIHAAADGSEDITAEADMIFVARAGDEASLSILAAGQYRDRFTRTQQGWRFARREIIFA